MSLADAIKEITEEMEQDLQQPELTADHKFAVRFYHRLLKTALKASEGREGESTVGLFTGGLPLGPMHHRQMIELAREEFRSAKKSTEGQEAVDSATVGLLALAVGGESDGDSVPIEPGMPCGAKTLLPGGVYVFGEDRMFHFSEEETTKYKTQQQGGKT